MPTPQSPSPAGVIGGKLYVAGGSDNRGGCLNTLALYDPGADTWTSKGPLPQLHHSGAIAVINGKLYAASGSDCSGNTNTLHVYDPVADTWTMKTSMPAALTGSAAGVINGKLYVAGGNPLGQSPRNTLFIYDPDRDSWSSGAPIPTPRNGMVAGVIDGKLYVAGGMFVCCSSLATLEAYDPATNTWTTKASLPLGRNIAMGGAIGERLYVAGGINETGTGNVTTLFIYDSITDTWTTGASAPTARAGAATGIIDGKLYIVGGCLTSGCPTDIVEVYTPETVQPISADAGEDATVLEGAAVALAGSASPTDGATFSWSQLAGPAVTLSDPSSPAPSFTAPLLAGGFGSQTLTFELTVTRAGQTATDTVDVTVVNVNHAPVAHAGDDQGVREGALVALSAALSFDPDGDGISFAWVQTGGTAVTLMGADTAAPTFTAPLLPGGVGAAEVLTFLVTVSDGGLSASDDVTVVVEQDNHAPAANAGAPQTVRPGVVVALDGSTSSDPDTDPISFSWAQVAGPPVTLGNADTAAPIFTAPPANGAVPLTFRLTVTDGQLTSEPSDVVITVNNGPPLCELARAVPNELWPPNHKMVPIRIVGVTDPEDSTVAITVTGVTQDEPVNGLGDGDTAPDAVITADTTLLRAERGGLLNGRVYQIHFAADDGQGGVCAGAVSVWVPKSKKAGESFLDDGQLYDSTQP